MRKLLLCLAGILLSSCLQAKEPFDPARCQLELETRLSANVFGEDWRTGKETFLEFVFDERGGDVELLDQYLKQRGYFPVAQAPDDPASKNLRIFFPERGPNVEHPADPRVAPEVACKASYVSEAKLVGVGIRSGTDRIFEVKLK